MQCFTIKIAKTPFQLQTRNPALQDKYHAYLTDEAPVCTVSVSDEELDALRSEHHPVRLLSRLRQRTNANSMQRMQDEENVLYRKISMMLPRYHAFILHGAAVSLDGCGYIFSGRSGVGKSTHANLWLKHFGNQDRHEPDARARMINGDKPILMLDDGQWYVCGSPWQGKENLGNPIAVPLKGICFLTRGENNRITPATHMTDWLFNAVLLPNEAATRIEMLSLLDSLIEQIPVYHMDVNNFAPDAVLVSSAALTQTLQPTKA